MKKGITVIALTVLVTMVLWYNGLTSTTLTLNLLTRIFGLVGAILLGWNFMLSTRLKVFDNLFDGLDNVYTVHHWIGQWGFLLVLSHPITLILNALDKSLGISKFLLPSVDASYSFGIFALYLFIILLIVTIFVKLPYHLWKITHDFMGLPLLFLILHVYMISSDVTNNFALRIWVLSFLIIAFISYVYKRFLYESSNKNEYSVEEIENVGEKTWTVKLKNLGNVKTYVPGNFIFLKKQSGEGSDELHPFSIIGSNEKGDITIGVKQLGDYTDGISEWKIEDNVLVYGPHGRFGRYFKPEEKQIWIAGGIGITPFLSVLENYEKNNIKINATLIYLVRDDNNVPFLSLLTKYSQSISGFKLHIWNTQKDGKFNPKSCIENDIEKYLICASKGTTSNLIENLENNFVKRSKIKKELFTLY